MNSPTEKSPSESDKPMQPVSDSTAAASAKAAPAQVADAPPPRRGPLVWFIQAVPTAIVLCLLIFIGYWGHSTGWKAPHTSAWVRPTAAAGPAWCAEHNVPAEICIACNADLMSKGQLYGWCREHGVAECVLEHPELAQLGQTPEISVTDLQRAAETLVVRPRAENNSACQLHLRRIQFASDEAADKAGIDIRFVDRGPILETIPANGQVAYDPTRVARLSARSGGTVWRVEKNLGDAVQAGEVLALVESAAVGRAKAELLQAAAQLDLKAETYRRFLGAEDAVSRQRLLEAQTELEAAEISLQSAVQALVNLGLPLTIDQVRSQQANELADQLRWLGLPSALTAQLDSQTTSANLLPVVAPRAGVVTSRDVVAGELVEAGQPIFAVIDTSRMWLLLDVAQEEVPYLQLDQEVRFESDGALGEHRGRITWLSTDLDPETRTVKVRAELANERGQLRSQMYGSAQIVLRYDEDAIVVPSEAIHWEGCCHVAFVRDRHYLQEDSYKVYHTRMVRPGVTQRGQTEVIAGLLPGELVVTHGGGALRSELLKGNLGAG